METKECRNYEFTGETMQYGGHVLHRIRALRDIITDPTYGNPWIKQGELGGWIESEKNLLQNSQAWVADNAKVYGNATVRGMARVQNSATVADSAFVGEHAYVSGSVRIGGKARIYGESMVSGNATVRGAATVCEDARISGNAYLDGKATAMGNCYIIGDAKILDSAMVSGGALVEGNAVVCDTSLVSGRAMVRGTAKVQGHTVLNGNFVISEGIILNRRIENERELRVKKIPSKINGMWLTLEQKEAMFAGKSIQIPSKSDPNKKISVKLNDHNNVVIVTKKKMSQSVCKCGRPRL